MKLGSRWLAMLCLYALSAPVRPALAQESGAFVVTLGTDTTSVEKFTRQKDQLVIDQVGRAPRTLRRTFTLSYKGGVIQRLSGVVTAPGTAAPVQTIEATFDADSMRAEIKNAANPPTPLHAAVRAGTVVVVGSSPWSVYEDRIQAFMRTKADTVGGALYFLGGGPDHYLLRRIGRDSVAITNTHGDEYHAAVDRAGHITGTLPVAGTQKFAIRRVPSVDLDATAANWQAREQGGAGMGVLSPRDSVKVTAGGAAIAIDYGRPAKRGRTVFGGIVPYGEVWRTGANAATQFRTDKALDFGGTVVPAGFYTLWTMPTATGWQLIVNGETGQWGTQHKPERDLFKIDMKLSTLPQVVERFTISVDATDTGGTLNLDWDTTRASATFATQH